MRTRVRIPVSGFGVALLARLLVPQPALADGECRIRRAEATLCPVFQVLEEATSGPAVSGDGRTLVGGVREGGGETVPMRWVDGEPRPLPGLPDALRGAASAVSRDGSVIAGSSYQRVPTFAYHTFLWEDGAIRLLDAGPGIPPAPTGISGDGTVFSAVRDTEGFRWSEQGGFEPWLVSIPNASSAAWAADVSDDGSRIVGWAEVIAIGRVLMWEGDTTTELAVPLSSGGRPWLGTADAISPDGGTVVGRLDRCEPRCEAVGALWTDGVLTLRDAPGVAATWDGTFVLEWGAAGPSLARPSTGFVRSLDAILADLGVPPSEPLYLASDMSYDGHVVVGRTTLAAPAHPFRAVISPKLGIDIEPWRRSNRIDLRGRRPVVVRVYGSEQADASQIPPQELRFGPARAPAIDMGAARDWNRDGHLDRDFAFDPAEAGIAFGDREACLAGVAADLPFRLCSRIQTGWGRWSWPLPAQLPHR